MRESTREDTREYPETRLFGLGALAVAIRWLTEFLLLANVLLLMLGSTIAATDLLTNGALTHLSGTFDLLWGTSQAVTVEILFITAFVRAAQCGRQGRHGAMVGWIAVGLILAIPTIQASLVYSMTRTLGITTTQALAQLHLPVFTWLVTRAVLVAFVGALDGWVSYAPDDHQHTRTVAERVQELEDQSRIAAARGRLHQARARAVVGIATSTVKAFGRTDQDTASSSAPPDDTSDEAAPVRAKEQPSSAPSAKAASGRRIYSLAEAKRLHQQKAQGSTQRIVFSFLERHPTARLKEIQEATGVGRTAVAKYKKLFQQHSAAEAE